MVAKLCLPAPEPLSGALRAKQGVSRTAVEAVGAH